MVDDDDAIGAVLRRAGHAVCFAEDGEDAIGKVSPGRFDLVITDIVMPRREGIETLRALRDIGPPIRIVAMSGGSGVDDGLYLKAALALGADATLEKPFDGAELCHIVDDALATPPSKMAALWYREPRSCAADQRISRPVASASNAARSPALK